MARLPISDWSAIVRDLARIVISYCRRHVVKGRVHVNEIDGGVEVVIFVEQPGPIAHHGASSSGSNVRDSVKARVE